MNPRPLHARAGHVLAAAALGVGCQILLSESGEVTTGAAAASDAGIDGRDGANPQPDAGITYRGLSNLTSAQTQTLSIPNLREARPGDLVWLALELQGTKPLGITLLDGGSPAAAGFADRGSMDTQGPGQCNNGQGGTHTTQFYSRIAEAVEPPYEFLFPQPVYASAVVVGYGGVDDRNPIANQKPAGRFGGTTDGGVITYVVPGIPESKADAELLYFIADVGGGSWATAEPLTPRVTGGFLALFTGSSATGGASPRTFTVQAAPACQANATAMLVALRPR